MSPTRSLKVRPDALEVLEQRYNQTIGRSGLPHRMPSHRIADQLVATAQACAYAQALADLTGAEAWHSRAAELEQHLRTRIQLSQSDIDSGESAEQKLRRYGLP